MTNKKQITIINKSLTNKLKIMKYKLTENFIIQNDKKLYQIQSLKNFSNVEVGELGGYVESENNLSQKGDCWISGNARVYNNARVSGNARVYDNAGVSGNARVSGNAIISDTSKVSGNARVCCEARVSGNSFIF